MEDWEPRLRLWESFASKCVWVPTNIGIEQGHFYLGLRDQEWCLVGVIVETEFGVSSLTRMELSVISDTIGYNQLKHRAQKGFGDIVFLKQEQGNFTGWPLNDCLIGKLFMSIIDRQRLELSLDLKSWTAGSKVILNGV